MEEEFQTRLRWTSKVVFTSKETDPAALTYPAPFKYKGILWPTKQHALTYEQLIHSAAAQPANAVARQLMEYAGTDPYKAAYMGIVAVSKSIGWDIGRLTVMSNIVTQAALQNCRLARLLLHPKVTDDFPRETTFEYQSKIPMDADTFWQMPGNQLGKAYSEARYVLRLIASHMKYHYEHGLPLNRTRGTLPFLGRTISRDHVTEAIINWYEAMDRGEVARLEHGPTIY